MCAWVSALFPGGWLDARISTQFVRYTRWNTRYRQMEIGRPSGMKCGTLVATYAGAVVLSRAPPPPPPFASIPSDSYLTHEVRSRKRVKCPVPADIYK